MADTSLVFNILAKDKASKAFDKLKGAAAMAGVAIGAALAAGLTETFEKEKALDKLAAQLGDAPWADAAGQAAGNLYSNAFGESLAEVTAATRSVLQGGLLGGDATQAEIEAITSRAMGLATAFDQEVGATARAAAQMIKTGMAGNASEALDILTVGFQKTGDLAGDLLDTFSEYSTVFRQLGLDGEMATGLMAQGLAAGARDVDTVADAIKEFSIRAIDGSTTTAAAFTKIGLNASQMTSQIAAGGDSAEAGLALVMDRLRAMKDPTEQMNAAVGLFGTKAEDLGQALFALDPSSAVAALGKVDGAAARLGDTLQDNAATKLEAFKRKATEAFTDELAKAIPTLEKVLGFLSKHTDVVVPLVAALVTFVGVVYAITAAMKIYTAVQWLMNAAMSANPIGLIIIAVIALVAGLVLLWKNSETFRTVVTAVFNGIGAAAVWLWNYALKPVWDGLVWLWKNVVAPAAVWLWNSVLKPAWDGIVVGVKWVWEWVQRSFLGWKILFARVGGFISAWWTGTKQRFTTAVDFFKSLPGRIAAGLSSLKAKLMAPFRAAFNAVAGLWNRTLGNISFTVPSWVPGVGGKGWSFPKLPMLAAGGDIVRAGWAMVGERGPEVLHLPAGASVTPLGRPGGGGGGGGGGQTVLEFTSDGSRLGDLLVEMMREAVRVRGRGNVQVAFGR